ncbi:MAG TPA: hypothetical protein ENG45_01780 [Candidatus Aenigmarchaeota archaeon]|nr:hypothetical protein [Candidatus Aenigmarchaeota archaeon]
MKTVAFFLTILFFINIVHAYPTLTVSHPSTVKNGDQFSLTFTYTSPEKLNGTAYVMVCTKLFNIVDYDKENCTKTSGLYFYRGRWTKIECKMNLTDGTSTSKEILLEAKGYGKTYFTYGCRDQSGSSCSGQSESQITITGDQEWLECNAESSECTLCPNSLISHVVPVHGQDYYCCNVSGSYVWLTEECDYCEGGGPPGPTTTLVTTTTTVPSTSTTSSTTSSTTTTLVTAPSYVLVDMEPDYGVVPYQKVMVEVKVKNSLIKLDKNFFVTLFVDGEEWNAGKGCFSNVTFKFYEGFNRCNCYDEHCECNVNKGKGKCGRWVFGNETYVDAGEGYFEIRSYCNLPYIEKGRHKLKVFAYLKGSFVEIGRGYTSFTVRKAGFFDFVVRIIRWIVKPLMINM